MSAKADKLQKASEKFNELLSAGLRREFPPELSRREAESLFSQLRDGEQLLFWWGESKRTSEHRVLPRSADVLDRIAFGRIDLGEATHAALWFRERKGVYGRVGAWRVVSVP